MKKIWIFILIVLGLFIIGFITSGKAADMIPIFILGGTLDVSGSVINFTSNIGSYNETYEKMYNITYENAATDSFNTTAEMIAAINNSGVLNITSWSASYVENGTFIQLAFSVRNTSYEYWAN